MKLRDRLKGVFQKVAADTKLSKEYKDIFELEGVPAFNEFYNFGIFIWKCLYKGFYAPWHLIPAPSIADPGNKRNVFRMDLAKAVCSEMASLIWSESCQVNITRDDWEPTEAEPEDILNCFVQDVLRKNGFWTKMQALIEQEQALGGAAIKVWFEPDRNAPADTTKVDADGYAITPGHICLGYCEADQFVPLSWDNACVREGIFISRLAKDGYYYTRLEWHKWEGTTYVITNELYRAEIQKNKAPESQDILGFRYPLALIYPELNERTEITGDLIKSLFSYFHTPVANNIDDNSPLGISLYGNALDTLHALDICYDSFVREFRLGKKRIIVPARCIRTIIDPITQVPRRYFDATDETYEALNTEDPDSLKIQDNSVALRVEEHVEAINAFLSILCMQVGFSASTFSFDLKSGLKTATEVVSENSKTYKTVQRNQSQITEALQTVVDNIITIACLYGVDYEGHSIKDLIKNGYSCKVIFDDSIIQDRQTNITEGLTLIGAGVLSKKSFLVDTLGYTEEQADAELERIAAEGHVSASTDIMDQLNVFAPGE